MKVSIAFLPRLMCTLNCDDGVHMVDVVENCNDIELWLYHRDYCVKSMIFGLSKANLERESWGFADLIELVEDTLESEHYLANYDNDYVDEA